MTSLVMDSTKEVYNNWRTISIPIAIKMPLKPGMWDESKIKIL